VARKALDPLVVALRPGHCGDVREPTIVLVYPDSQSLHAEQRVSGERDEGLYNGICCSGHRGRTPHGCSGRPAA